MWRSPERVFAAVSALVLACVAVPVIAQQAREAPPPHARAETPPPARTAPAVPPFVAAQPIAPRRFGLGREATREEVAGWAIAVRPDGQGLPEGRGTPAQGEEIFSQQCAACHGEFGEGAGRWPMLAGGQGSLGRPDPKRTVGSYWPYLSTLFDYTRRAMPFGNAQTLSADELYAVVAYMLYVNDIVTDRAFELNRETFRTIRMPNQGGFIEEDTADTPSAQGRAPCMTECSGEVRVIGRARVLDVTPDGGGAQRPRVD